MDNTFTKIITDTILNAVNEHSFKESCGVYKNEAKAFKVEYNDEKKQFVLFVADVTEGELEFLEKSSWLFDQNHNKQDAECVGADFAETVLKELGVNKAKTARRSVELPEKAQAGKAVSVSALCSSLLAVYPQYKDAYKEHVEHYGEFLCIKFFKDTVCVQLKEQLLQNNKKQVKKVIDVLCDAYVNGDRAVCNIIPEAIILRAVGEDEALLNTALSYMDDCPYLSTALKALAKRLKTDKKLRKVVLGE